MVDGFLDLDELLLRCRNRQARSYADEAVKCYRAGAFRATIVTTWIAVVFDLIEKMRELSLSGDENAQRHVEEFEAICRAHDIARSLAFERNLLSVAKGDFEILSQLEHDDLRRLFEDRHKCAHPSMLNPTEEYQPTAELARAHLRHAVDHCLSQPPTQGKAALERILADLSQSSYPEQRDELIAHLEHGPLGRPRVSLLRNCAVVLAKDLLQAPAAPESETPLEKMRRQWRRQRRIDRVIGTIEALAVMHRDGTTRALSERLEAMVSGAPDRSLGVVVRLLSRVPDLWPALGQAQQNRLVRYTRDMLRKDMASCLRPAWQMEGLKDAALERVRKCSGGDWSELGPPPLPRQWIEIGMATLKQSQSWDASNAVCNGMLIPSAGVISRADLSELIAVAAANGEVRHAFGFLQLLQSLTLTIGMEEVCRALRDGGIYDVVKQQVTWLPE